MRLVRVEVRRILARTLVLVAMLGGLAGVGVTLLGTQQSTRPLTAEEVAAAERMFEEVHADWVEHHEEWLGDCLEQEAAERETTGDDTIDWYCEESDVEPVREDWLPQSPELEVTLPLTQGPMAILVAFITFVVGATATAAEMSAGTMSTWLTFVPQRGRVLASKLLAPALVAVPVAVVLLAAHVAGTYVIHDVHGLTDGMDAAAWTDALATTGRSVALAAATAALGAAAGVLARHTGIVLGALVGYLVVFEGMLRWSLGRFQPALLGLNVEAFVNDGAAYWVQTCEVSAEGTYCEGTEMTLGLAQASVYLAVLAVVVLAVTAVVFRRRDLA